MASAAPATVRCASIIAGMVWDRWYGEESGAPDEVWNRPGWMPNSIAAASAEALIPAYPPRAAATIRRRAVSAALPATSRYTPYPTNGRTIAMLSALAPNASTPPSPNSSAWNSSATDTAMTAAQGPRATAMSTPPTACAVVPSGIGMLNIMMRKLSAARIARVGTLRVLTTRDTRRAAIAQVGNATA